MAETQKLLQSKLDKVNLEKLMALNNPKLNAFVADAIELTEPDKVAVFTDSAEDLAMIRSWAVNGGGEKPLAMEGHTYHFDGPNDQGRDTFSTRYLLPKGMELGESLNSIERQQGLDEVRTFLKGSMKGRTMMVCFWCLCPTGSDFSISCAQITDSPYVAHSESMLYRPGYEQFKRLNGSEHFFRFLHSEGETDENGCSIHWEKRRVYIDLTQDMVYSANTQYAGNTVGLKKLALRLAIQRASRDGNWLAEHMFIMGAKGPKDRTTYFVGAFPSACGKTSTAMLPGQSIIGDDIAYFRKRDGHMHAANVEQGIFGIIGDVNSKDDPVIFTALKTPGEVIFGNVLIADGRPYWDGMGEEIPDKGVNFSGPWHTGKTDKDGKAIPPSHKNARYTIRLSALANLDKEADNPAGVPVGGVIYGGRDSDTQVPVEQAFDWVEGIVAKGASIESETTAATLGKAGVRKFNIMANQDFVSIPLGKYIQNNLDFAKGITPPAIFSVNYFLQDENGKFLNGKLDKMVWLLWAELRVNGDVEALKTPTGWIPKYEDLAPLFKSKLNAEYTKEAYEKQFTVRIENLLAKYDRVEQIYREKVSDTPQTVYDTFAAIRKRLQEAQSQHGNFINPFTL